MLNENNDNALIIMMNGMGVLLLTLSLVNLVKYRFEWKSNSDRIRKIEDAKNDRILEDALKNI